MRGQKLAKPDMLNGIGHVPAGVVEIIKKQQQGVPAPRLIPAMSSSSSSYAWLPANQKMASIVGDTTVVALADA